MYPIDDNKDRVKRDRINDFLKRNYDIGSIIREMERIIEGIYRDDLYNDDDEAKEFFSGIRLNSDQDRNSNTQRFGNSNLIKMNEEKSITDNKEQETDIIEYDNYISITTKLPEIDSKDIKLNVKKNKLEIKADTSQGIYNKEINLPCEIKQKIKTITFKNGLLDVIAYRKHKKKKDKGFRVNIE